MRPVSRAVFCIVAAGTGGHILPGLVLAEEGRKRGYEVILCGRKRGMEEKLIKENSPYPFVGYPYLERGFFFLLNLVRGLIQCLFFFLRHKVKAVVVCGSYASLPPVLAGIILRLPIYLLEQNRVPGKMIKFFAPFARAVFFAFPPIGRRPGIITGNPIRKEIKSLGLKISNSFGDKILVLGGSQGAHFLTFFFLELARDFPEEKFLIQVRKEDEEKVKERAPTNVSTFVFNPNIEELYSGAKLIISRAGGSTLSEILHLGIPMILIPYPYAAQNHQEENARFCHEVGCAVMMRERDLLRKKDELKRVIRLLLSDEGKRKEMREKAKEWGRDGGEKIWEIISKGLRLAFPSGVR